MLWVGRAVLATGDYAGALKAVEDFKKDFPDSSYRAAAGRLGAKCHLRMNRHDAALELFARLLRDYPDAPEAPENLLDWAGVLMQAKRGAEAEQLLDRLVRDFPAADAAAEGALWLATLQSERLDPAAAERTLAALAARETVRADRRAAAWFALAGLYESRTNLPAAVDALEKGARMTPDPEQRVQGDIQRGRLMVRSGRAEEGLALLKESVGALPSERVSGRAQLELADMLLERGLYERALEEFQRYLESFSDKDALPRAVTGKAWSLWALGRYAEAAPAFEKAASLQTDPAAKAQALLKSADACFANRQYQLANERYRRVAEEYANTPWASQAGFQSAECLVRQGEGARAEKMLQDLARGSGELAERALMRIGRMGEEAGQWEEALTAYGQVAGTCTNAAVCAEATHRRGVIRYRLGRFQDALGDFERVVRDFAGSPVSEQAYYMRGWCFYLLGEDQKALDLCRQFIATYPASAWAPDVIFWLGEYHYNRGNYAEAERQFALLIDRHPGVPLADAALFWAGRAASERKEYLRAIEYFTRLARSYPDSPKLAEARFAQGDALSELGQFDAAILAFEEIIVKYPDSYLVDLAWGRKGDCQFTLANDAPVRYQEALLSYKTVLDSPRATRDLKAQAEYKIGRCREKMGQKAEALESYMSVVYGYLQAAEKGEAGSPVWFTRAAFGAAAIKEAEQKWREAVSIYRRVVDANVPAASEAQSRIQKIRFEHWVLF